MEQIIKSYQSLGIYGIIIPGFLVLYIIGMVFYMKRRKNNVAKWVEAHPNYVKVYLRSGMGIITSKDMRYRVLSGEACREFVTEKMTTVIYAQPGELELELTYSYTRPGVMYKRVTTTWGPTVLKLALEANKTYALSFDKNSENFVLSEE